MKEDIEQTLLLHLGRVEGKLDAILSHQDRVTDRLDDHGKRINKLEMFRSWQLGASAVVASLVAGLIGFFKGGH